MPPSAAGAEGLAAPGRALAAGRFCERFCPVRGQSDDFTSSGLTAMPAGAAFGAFLTLGFLGGMGLDTGVRVREPLRRRS